VILIRGAAKADMPAVLRLLHQLDNEDEPQISEEDATRIFERMDTYPDYGVFVAEVDGTIAGTFTLLLMDKRGHNGKPAGIVEDVVVDEGRRGHGIGKEMMRSAMEYCRARGCYKLALSSNERRTEAHAFYESLGFRRHGFSFLIEL
jgi:GNAT superfamily N-acetyltransferase